MSSKTIVTIAFRYPPDAARVTEEASVVAALVKKEHVLLLTDKMERKPTLRKLPLVKTGPGLRAERPT